MRYEQYKKARIVKPRAFWVRLATATVPVALLYALFIVNYIKAVRAFSPTHIWQVAFTLAYTAVFAGVISGLAYTLKRWCWETVYIIVGTVRFEGLSGTVIPAGVRISTIEHEYITVSDTMVGKDGKADVEICIRWSER